MFVLDFSGANTESNNNSFLFPVFFSTLSPGLEPSFPFRDVKIKVDEDPEEKFNILPELGRGSFGTVFLCNEKASGLELAVKIVNYKKKKEKTMIEMEIDILASLKHNSIIQIYDAFDCANKIFCFLELYGLHSSFKRQHFHLITNLRIFLESKVENFLKE